MTMRFEVNLAKDRIEVSPYAGGLYATMHQHFGIDMLGADATLEIVHDELSINISGTDEQLRYIARTIDSYISATTGKSIWDVQVQPILEDDEELILREEEE